MDTLDNIKTDARDVLLAMKSIGECGPSKANAHAMLDKMSDLQDIANRIDDLPDEQ